MSSTCYSPRYAEALAYAAEAHATQRRKASDIPYIAHLLRVSALVWDNGGDEDQAIAALLHDTAEDQGGAARLADIEARFGPVVAGIVDACSDSLVDTSAGQSKAPWKERKEHHLARARKLEGHALMVMVADKVDNAESVLADLRLGDPDEVFSRFTGGVAGTAWYYGQMAAIAAERLPGPLAKRLVAAADGVASFADTLSSDPGELPPS